MPRLGVNVDYVATLRQPRRTRFPDPVAAAAAAERAGASEIKVHFRGDRRHIQERDLNVLRETVETSFNLQLAPTQDNLKVAYEIKPAVVTLVPERPDELTTERGLDVGHHREHLKKYIVNLGEADIETSLFVDPDLEQIRLAHRVEASALELNTSGYAEARDDLTRRGELQKIVDAARAASKLGMRVSAGHRLDYQNIADLVAIGDIAQFNVGHAIVSRALFSGFEQAVRDMASLLGR
jgi:pyridoxine 5-phosphate synthase